MDLQWLPRGGVHQDDRLLAVGRADGLHELLAGGVGAELAAFAEVCTQRPVIAL